LTCKEALVEDGQVDDRSIVGCGYRAGIDVRPAGGARLIDTGYPVERVDEQGNVMRSRLTSTVQELVLRVSLGQVDQAIVRQVEI